MNHMDTSPAHWKLIALIAGVVIVVALAIGAIFFFFHLGAAPAGNAQNATGTNNASTTAVTTVTNSAPGGNGNATASAAPNASGGATQNIPALPGPAITIHLLTPISGNVWTIGGTNSIAWDNFANITGEIDLVNANTKVFIGVILSETGSHQTSYSWDARSIYLSRYGADKKDVVPGTYSIRIHFDGNGLGSLVSGPITITN